MRNVLLLVVPTCCSRCDCGSIENPLAATTRDRRVTSRSMMMMMIIGRVKIWLLRFCWMMKRGAMGGVKEKRILHLRGAVAT